MNLNSINELSKEQAQEEFSRCCGSARWSSLMVEKRPFAGRQELFSSAEEGFQILSADDWLESFRHHPQIGNLNTLATKYGHSKDLAKNEQRGLEGARLEVLTALENGNQDYRHKFGYIFIVCASGKTAHEMLNLLLQRLPNDPEKEFEIAKSEQKQISRIRLEKLLT